MDEPKQPHLNSGKPYKKKSTVEIERQAWEKPKTKVMGEVANSVGMDKTACLKHTKSISNFWDEFLSERDNFDLMKRLVYRKIKDPETTEEALSYVNVNLLADEKKHLQAYNPDRNAKAFFCFIVLRLIRDFKREKWGRYRPPKALLKDPDFLLVLVHKLLCWQKVSEDDVFEQLKDSGNNPEQIRKAIIKIRERYINGKPPKPRVMSMDDKDEGLDQKKPNPHEINSLTNDIFNQNSEDPETKLEKKCCQYMIDSQWSHLYNFILNKNAAGLNESSPGYDKINKIKKKLESKFKVTNEDRLFLRMIYQDGMTVVAAGRKLNWGKFVALGRHRRLIGKLRELIPKDMIKDFVCSFERL